MKKYIKTIIFAAIIILILVLNHYFGWSDYLSDTDNLMFLKKTVEENFLWALCIYIVLTIIGCVVLALPGITFAVAAGILFGPFMGIFACLIATTLGAMLAFLVGRFFLKESVKPMLEKNKLLKRLLFSEDGKSDMIVLMITRMVPLFPYNLQNFAYGITDIGFWKYSIFTFIFMLPGVSFFTIGSAGLTAEGDKWKYFLTAGVLAALVTAAGILIQRKFLGNVKEDAIILFTRVPIPGQTKTRLMPFLTGEDCAALHSEFIRNASLACQGVDADLLVYYTQEYTDKADSLKKLVKGARGFYPQKGEGLGERMSQAFNEVFGLGYERVLLVGTDIPQITADIFRQSFQDLQGCDAVINPTEDGGYYLIGLKSARNDIWDVPHYGTNTVFEDTLSKLFEAELRVSTGQMLRDIDTKEDLMAWYGADRCIHCGACTKSCNFLEKYGINLTGFARRPELAYSCFLCGRCKAVCPKDIDGARIAVLMRQMRSDRASYKGLLWEKSPYKFANYRKGRKKSVLFPGCNFTAFYPKTTGYLEHLMSRYDIGTIYDCCGKPVYELGLKGASNQNLDRINSRLKKQGVEEFIVLCPNCYHFLKDRLEIPMVTIYQKLKELGEGQMVKKDRIPIYYPCPDREKKEMFQEVFQYLAGEVTEPFGKVQCCGLGGCAGVKEPELSKGMAESAMKYNDELYTYCASCISNFRRKGMEGAYHILPLILGVEEKVPLGIQPFMNRARRKLL